LDIENTRRKINMGSKATLSTYNIHLSVRGSYLSLSNGSKFWDIEVLEGALVKNGISVTERTTKLCCARKNAVFAGGVIEMLSIILM
jgi:hypothetical protein